MTEESIQNILREFHVPGNIQAHMEKVAKICVYIGMKIIERGSKIDLKALEQAARLHDLVKFCDFKDLKPENIHEPFSKEDFMFWKELILKYNHLGHVLAAFEILKQRGEDKIAVIIKKHHYECLIDPSPTERPTTWEEKILYYADKRVKHNKIVSVTERIEDGRKRYLSINQNLSDDEKVYRAILKLEKEICAAAGIRPEDIKD